MASIFLGTLLENGPRQSLPKRRSTVVAAYPGRIAPDLSVNLILQCRSPFFLVHTSIYEEFLHCGT